MFRILFWRAYNVPDLTRWRRKLEQSEDCTTAGGGGRRCWRQQWRWWSFLRFFFTFHSVAVKHFIVHHIAAEITDHPPQLHTQSPPWHTCYLIGGHLVVVVVVIVCARQSPSFFPSIFLLVQVYFLFYLQQTNAWCFTNHATALLFLATSPRRRPCNVKPSHSLHAFFYSFSWHTFWSK